LGGHAFGTGSRTRQDQVVRFNVARVLGGYTPGPGNVEFTYPTYTVDENAGSLGLEGGMNAQCGWYCAPSAIHCLQW